MKKFFKDYNTVVIKIGSSLVVDSKKNKVNSGWLESLAKDINELVKLKKKVAIVTSGAIAIGRKTLGKDKRNLKLAEKQAAAACGQLELIGAYQKAFGKYKHNCAQILLTYEDSEDRRRYLNARNTLQTLLDAVVIPVINENDTVATTEIRVGDNDRLAARVAQMISADLLILFSDIDGLYTADPRKDKTAKHIKEIKTIDKKIEDMAGDAGSNVGTGGMVTKIMAAQIAINSSCSTIITLGENKRPISKLAEGGKHTIFIAEGDAETARKAWISESLGSKGEIIIDDGAVKALKSGKSLLPAGVVEIKGNFNRGDKITVKTRQGAVIGKGLSSYDSDDAKKIIGKKTSEIEKILGEQGRLELIHRDDLVVKA